MASHPGIRKQNNSLPFRGARRLIIHNHDGCGIEHAGIGTERPYCYDCGFSPLDIAGIEADIQKMNDPERFKPLVEGMAGSPEKRGR